MCPSAETSLKELVTQVAAEDGLGTGKKQTEAIGAGLSAQKMGERFAEIQEQFEHVFDGQTQVRREIEQMKVEMLAKVSKQELETQLLLKANKQSVANAL